MTCLRASRFGAAGPVSMWHRVSALCRARMATFTMTAAAIVAGGSRVLACPVCFGAEESSIIDGTKMGILVLLAVTFVVQGAFLGFFFYLRRRAKRHSEEELEAEWSNLQRASRTS